MRYKLLGKSGLRVSEVCLGTMSFGEEGTSREECRKLFDAFAELGGNFLDTSNSYSQGASERMVAELVASERDRFVVATKFTLSTRRSDPNASGNHRKNMVHSLESSLKRLKTDYVDLYWVQAWDYRTPTEETLRSLDDLVRAGKVLYIGISDTPAWVVAQANTMAELRGWSRFVGLQIDYSLIQRSVERDLLPMARHFDIAVLAWDCLGGGVLSGKYAQESPGAPPSEAQPGDLTALRLSEKNRRIAAEVSEIASSLGRTPAQVALNWVRQQRGVVIPIVGARTAAQAVENLGCLDFELDHDQRHRLSKASHIDLGFPYEYLNSDSGRRAGQGEVTPMVDNHREWR